MGPFNKTGEPDYPGPDAVHPLLAAHFSKLLFSNTMLSDWTHTNMILDITFTFSVSEQPLKIPNLFPGVIGLRGVSYLTQSLSSPHAVYLNLEKHSSLLYLLSNQFTVGKNPSLVLEHTNKCILNRIPDWISYLGKLNELLS